MEVFCHMDLAISCAAYCYHTYGRFQDYKRAKGGGGGFAVKTTHSTVDQVRSNKGNAIFPHLVDQQVAVRANVQHGPSGDAAS